MSQRSECEDLPGRLRGICEGNVAMPLEKINAYRERWGLGPLDSAAVGPLALSNASLSYNRNQPRQQSPQPAGGLRKSGCGSCGGGKTRPVVPAVIPPRKSIASRATTLLESAKKHLADDNAETHPDALRHRLAACNSCAMNVDGECRLCGCPLYENMLNKGKLKWRSESCPAGKWTKGTPRRMPLPRPTVRHLVMHVWPIKGNGAWQSNIEQILQRIGLFNGKRVMTIATDSSVDRPEDVMAAIDGYGFDVSVVRNNPKLREVPAFLPMLDKVYSLNSNEITFCCHAKGVRHAPVVDPGTTVHKWTNAMYETCLGDIEAVEAALEDYLFAGSFKRYGQFTTPGNHKWHYSGTFYWFRNQAVFSRKWRQIDQTFFGTESWPGRIAAEQEAACLFHDHCEDLYKMNYWNKDVEPELETWRNARRSAANAVTVE